MPTSSSCTTRPGRSRRRVVRGGDRRGARGADAAIPALAGRRHREARRRRARGRDGAARRIWSSCRPRRRSAPTRCAPRTRRRRSGPTTPRWSRPAADGRRRAGRDAQPEDDGRRRPRARPGPARHRRATGEVPRRHGLRRAPVRRAPPLVLGGVQIAEAPRSPGHSDGDAVAHAVADAAARRGRPPRSRHAVPRDRRAVCAARTRSSCCSDVAARVAQDGWWVDNVDVVVAAETPRLAPHVDGDGRTLVERARAGAPSRWARDRVSVKPKRGEGLGAIGRAEGIAVWAVALLDARLTRNRRRDEPAARRPGYRRCVLRIYDTAARAKVDFVPRRTARCRCTCAARRRTTCRTSVTAAPRSRSTRSAATCAGGATR